MAEEKQRLDYFDVAKGIGIILVIVGHSTLLPWLAAVIYSFHMPLFFIISGYFLSREKSTMEVMRSRFRQFALPFAVASTAILLWWIWQTPSKELSLLLVLRLIGSIVYASGGTIDFFNFELLPIGALWFIPGLLVTIFYVKFALSRKLPCLWVVTGTTAGLAVSQYIWLPLSICSGLMFAVYMYTGVLLREWQVLFCYPCHGRAHTPPPRRFCISA